MGLKNSQKNSEKDPGIYPGQFLPYMYPYVCACITCVYVRVCAPTRVCTRGRTKRRVPVTNVKRLARALRVIVPSTSRGVSSLRAINANKEKNPGLLIFKNVNTNLLF